MTIDKAIKHCKEVAKENREIAELISNRPLEVCDIHRKEDKCLECAKEHEQLAKWLSELKSYRGVMKDYVDGNISTMELGFRLSNLYVESEDMK